jgi:DNA-binding transcriptional regulator YdaS (Cro superfamily)
MRTLRRALQHCGGEAPLAKVLDVSVEALSSWLTGRETLPAESYLRVLGIVRPGAKSRAR